MTWHFYFVGWLGQSMFRSSVTKGHIWVSYTEKLGFNTMTWTTYLSSCGVESQVGPSRLRDVIYFMKTKVQKICAIFIHPHTHYAGQTDTFECFFPWGDGEDEEGWNCSSFSYVGWTLLWLSLARASWRMEGFHLKLHITFFLFFFSFSGSRCFIAAIRERFFFSLWACARLCVSSRLLFLILEKRKRMYDSSQSQMLCLIQLCLFISLWSGWVGEG